MPANQYGIDLADVYRTTAAVKGARTRNKLSSLQLNEAERVVAERPEKERLAKERKNLLTGLRGKAVAGDSDAAQQLLAIDPEGGPQFIDAVGKMDDRKREATKRTVDEIGQLSAYVLQGSSPEEQARRYTLMKSNVTPDTAAKLPEQYDPGFMELSLSKATAMDKLLEAPTVRTIGSEDVAYRGGREVERATKPVKGGAGGSGTGGGLKSGDESLMYRQAAELLGGIFDQTGNITNLDPDARNRVQAIATEATNIFVKEGNITRSEAVKRAAKAYGLDVKDVPTGELEDPLGIR